MALGAAPGSIVWLVLRRVAVLVVAGIAIGAAVSWWAGRFVATLLFGLDARDVATFAIGMIVLAEVGALGRVRAGAARREDRSGARAAGKREGANGKHGATETCPSGVSCPGRWA